MFKKGLIDMVGGNLNSIPLEEIPHLEKTWNIIRKTRPKTRFIAFNTEKLPFTNVKIRKALALAINRQELIGSFGNGVKKRISVNYINPGYKASLSATNMIPPCLKENYYRSFFNDNDIEQARILLQEGMNELNVTSEIFNSLVLYYDNLFSCTTELVQAIQQQWLNALGISIKIERLDYRTLMDKLTDGDYFMAHNYWTAMYFDQMSILERFKYKTHVKNFTNWEHPKYIQLIDKSFYELGDKRLRILEQAEKLFISEMPLIPIYHEDDIYIMNPCLTFTIPMWGDLILERKSILKKIQEFFTSHEKLYQKEKNQVHKESKVYPNSSLK
jgi:oligopeptide transport system substrate-binding protein